MARDDSDQVPDTTPVNSTSSPSIKVFGARAGTGIGESMPVWRQAAVPSTLRIDSETDVSGMVDQRTPRVFKLESATRTYTIGRGDQRTDQSKNDFSLPRTWNSISRDQGTLVMVGGEAILTNTSKNPNVFVRGESVAVGAARALRHGDNVQLGRCIGTFADGRYYSSAPPTMVDLRTGLLSRAGLVTEITGMLATAKARILVAIRAPEAAAPDPDRHAVAIALAIHRHAPGVPVARLDRDVVMLAVPDANLDELATIAAAIAGTRCAIGSLTLDGTASDAIPRLEACLAALGRVDATDPVDLARHVLVPTPIARFADAAHAILVVLDDLDRIALLAPQAIPVLELELVELIGARIGPHDLVAIAGPGRIAVAGSLDARELAIAWHARGAVIASSLEIDRGLSVQELDLAAIGAPASGFATGGWPAPIAIAASAIDRATTPLARIRALVTASEVGWQFLAHVLVAGRRGLPIVEVVGDHAWPAPWRRVAREASTALAHHVGRLADLAKIVGDADREPALGTAFATIATGADAIAQPTPDLAAIAKLVPQVELAVREWFVALAPLRGWTLVTVDDVTIIDPVEHVQRVAYLDFTGPTAAGSRQHVTVTGMHGLAPRFAYFVRWSEGLAIALEPGVRGIAAELVIADAPIRDPGHHRYRSLTGSESSLVVTAKQLGAKS